MKTLIKTFLIILALIVVLAVATPLIISETAVRQALIEKVEAYTGKTLEVNGALRVRFFPVASVLMEDAKLYDKSNKNFPPLLTVKSLSVGLEVLPLLSKHVNITKLELAEPSITIYRGANGISNLEIKEKKATPPKKRKKKKRNNSDKTNVNSIENIQLRKLSIVGGTLRFQDDKAKKRWDIKQIQLDSSMKRIDGSLKINGQAEWNQKMVRFEVLIDTLAKILNKEKVAIGLSAESSLFDFRMDGFYEYFEVSGKTNIVTPSLYAIDDWLSQVPHVTKANPLALKMSSNYRCSYTLCKFDELIFALDDLEAAGKVSIDISGRKPQLDIELSADKLDLNTFLPASGEEKAASYSLISSAYAAENKGWSKEIFDLSALDSLNATINIKAKELYVQSIEMSDTTLRAKLHNGRLSADVINAGLYNGKMDFTFSYDLPTSILRKSITLKSVDIEQLLTAAAEQDRVSGLVDASINIAGRGKSEHEIISGLAGNGKFSIKDGALKGVNIPAMLRNVKSAFNDVDTASQKTDFAELGGSFTIEKGILSNSDLAMKAPLMRASGAGKVDLPKRTINYRLKPELVETSKGQGGKDIEGVAVPVIIEGSWDKPRFRPDLESIARDAIKDPKKIENTVRGIRDKIKGGNKKEMLNNLKGLLR